MLLATLFSPVESYGQQVLFSLTGNENTGRGTEAMVVVDDVGVSMHQGATVSLHFSVALMGGTLPRRQRVVVTPAIVGDSASVQLPAVVLFGGWAYYQAVRAGLDDNSSDMHFRDRDVLNPQTYTKLTAYQPWMRTARVQFTVERLNGCGDVLASRQHSALTTGVLPTSARPQVQGGQHETTQSDTTSTTVVTDGASTRQFYQSSTNIDFPVNGTDIDPLYGNNSRRLEEIRNTIDSVLNGDMSTLRYIYLKGYASPEGLYDKNERLARERTQSLRRYIVDNFGIPGRFISTDYEAEDWQGLRNYVEASQLTERQALLDIIDSNLHPDAKLARIAERYPKAFHYLLENVFPTLRHTDYLIEKVVPGEGTTTVHTTTRIVTEKVRETGAVNYAIGGYLVDETARTPLPEATHSGFRTYRPLLALKTNLLFDAALAPNIEVEVPLGRKARWSVMGEVWCPWWRFGHNAAGEQNPYRRSDQRPTKYAYQLLTVGAEVRYWFAPRCRRSHPVLSGAFVGIYGAGGKYDLCWKSEGNQGEFTSLGLSLGYSWPISRHWNLELSAAGGYVGGPKVHYQNEFDDARLIYRSHNDHWYYAGPTKLKLSIVWLIGGKNKKGGSL